jgi:hypothetical protein
LSHSGTRGAAKNSFGFPLIACERRGEDKPA